MSLIEKITVPEGTRGLWRVERFEIPERSLASLWYGHRAPPPGMYTRLMRGHTVVMSDTPAEMRDHYRAVHAARGHVLINGLGLGMVLAACLSKPEVESVTVVEISPDVIALVAPHYSSPRVSIVLGDALSYAPAKDRHFGMVWHDIWDGICSDNLPDMHRLHRKYGRRADWQGSWCRYECERQRKVA